MNNLEKPLVIIPTLNEEEHIGEIIPLIFENLPSAEILVVDDNSKDNTADIVKSLMKMHPIHVLERRNKRGLGSAYIDGFRWGLKQPQNFDCFFSIDADLSHDPAMLPAFLEKGRNNHLVMGSRYIKDGGYTDWPFSRQLISKSANFVTKIFLGLKVKDFTSGFRLYRREFIEQLNLDQIIATGYIFQVEMTLRADMLNLLIEEIPIIFKNRKKGKSKMSFKEISHGLNTLWKLRKLKKL